MTDPRAWWHGDEAHWLARPATRRDSPPREPYGWTTEEIREARRVRYEVPTVEEILTGAIWRHGHANVAPREFEWCPACPAARCRRDRARDVWTCASCRQSWLDEHDASGRLLPNAPRPSLLPVRDLTPEERAAHDEDPRSGVWAGESDADLRALTQEETDTLIRAELWASLPIYAPEAERRDLTELVGKTRMIELTRPDRSAAGGVRAMCATRQRGGIDSDPIVRLLAYRAWGERDRNWIELRALRQARWLAESPPAVMRSQDLLLVDGDAISGGDLNFRELERRAMAPAPRRADITKSDPAPRVPDFIRGARVSGTKPTPHVPRWARAMRRSRSPVPGR